MVSVWNVKACHGLGHVAVKAREAPPGAARTEHKHGQSGLDIALRSYSCSPNCALPLSLYSLLQIFTVLSPTYSLPESCIFFCDNTADYMSHAVLYHFLDCIAIVLYQEPRPIWNFLRLLLISCVAIVPQSLVIRVHCALACCREGLLHGPMVGLDES